MLRFTLRQLRHRPGRGAALGAGILAAAAGFCLLSASVSTEQANVHATVDANLWPSYDILVRPAGTADPVPQGLVGNGLVPTTYLSGVYGGITQDQDTTIAHLAGVGVAAPVEVLGYVLEQIQMPIDITSYVSGGGDRLLRFAVTRGTDSGATTFPTQDEWYVLMTNQKVQAVLAPQQSDLGGGSLASSGSGGIDSGGTLEECAGGLSTPTQLSIPYSPSGCFMQNLNHVNAYLTWSVPVLVAGIDPAAENRLDGLGSAISSGRYLSETDTATTDAQHTATQLPVLAATGLAADDTATVHIESVDPGPVLSGAGHLTQDQLDSTVDAEHGTVLGTVKFNEQQAYQQMLEGADGSSALPIVEAYWTAGAASLTGTRGGVAVRSVAPNPPSTWTSLWNGQTSTVIPPIDVSDTAFRGLTEHLALNTNGHTATYFSVVGTFNPSAVAGSASTGSTQASLNIFSAPGSAGADDASRAALHGGRLLPNSNLAGYLQQPPTLLTTISALSQFDEDDFTEGVGPAPISAIRVKVSGLVGSDRQKLDRVAQVAYEIRKATGLTVSVVAGSSAQNVDVSLASGKFGRPALTVVQPWIGEGVGLVILDAVDRMSVLLFLIVLVATGLFLANGVNAAVRARRREIGVLRALGWGKWAVFRSILGEVALLGAVAGLLGSALSAALIAVLSLKVPIDRVLLVTPVAMLLSVCAGLLPAWRAARGRPTDVIAGSAATARRAPRVHGIPGLILSALLRAPWRAVTGAAALGIAVVTLAILLSLNARFGGQIGDSALSGLVDLQARGVDYLSATLAVLVGAGSVADLIYLGLRERSAEFAVFTAHGWHRRHVLGVALGEGLAVGLLGSGCGAAAAIALGGQWQASLVAAVAGIAIVLATVTAILALGRARQSAAVLAQED